MKGRGGGALFLKLGVLNPSVNYDGFFYEMFLFSSYQ